MFMGGLLKYTNILIIDTGNELTSIGVKKADAWYSNYQYRKQIVLDEALITGSTSLTNFPVLISMTDLSLRTTSNEGHVYNSNGYDIVFTDINDNKLDHEIEKYTASTGEIVMWVEIPSLSNTSDTTINMYYGNSSIGSSQENKTGVWLSQYKGVWHMNDASNSTITDSTSYLNTWTKLSTTEPSSATGKIAGGQSWDGSNDYASMSDNSNISPTTASNSFSAWLYIDTFGGSGENYIKNLLGDEGGGSFSTLWRLGSQGSSTYAQRLGVNYNNGSNHDTQNNTNLSSGTWVNLAVTTDGTNARWYINGVLDTTLAYTYIPQNVASTWYLGSYGTGSRRYDGIMDEVRMYAGTLSGDWVQAEYANQNNPGVGAGKFMQSVGSEVPLPVPSVTTSAASNITTTTADLNSNVNGNGEGVTIYYRYGTSNVACSSLPSNVTFGWIPSSSSPNAKNITGLSPNTTYYFCAYATGISTTYGSVLNFTTAASTPTITTPTKASVTFNSATLGGNITSQGGSAVDVRGVCYAITTTNANPEHGGTGVTCANHASGGTGIFTVDVTGLSASEGYSYKAFAHNTQGYAYTSADTFTTLTNAPISVTTNNESELGSYKVRFHGTANPNGSQAYGYFRVFPSVPDCTINSGGTRIPSNPNYDFDLGEGNSPVNFDIPTPSTINLTRDTDYWYCAYAWNEEAGVGSPATSASSGYDDFHTTDGPASGCDAPASGNMTVTESCSFPQTDYDGVDSGGNTSGNSAALILGSGGLVTLLPGQVIGVGSKSFQGGAFLIGNGSAGVILGGGVWLKDSDNDGYIDSPVTKIISRNQPAGYKRRNYVYTLPAYNTTSFNYASKIYNAATTAPTYLDCDETNGYIYREVANLVTDADNDGYKTSASAGPQCVGASTVINGRTYYNGGSGPN